MGHHALGINQWRSVLGTVGWLHAVGMEVVVQNLHLATQNFGTRTAPNELLRTYEMFLRYAFFSVELFIRRSGNLWYTARYSEKVDPEYYGGRSGSAIDREVVPAESRNDQPVPDRPIPQY